MAEVIIASFDYAGVKIKIWAEEDGLGNVVLRVDSGESTTTFDLNGLFIDYGNDGGSVTSVGSKANNMNGADSQDGTKFDGFDVGYELGSIGGKDANWMNGNILLEGKTLADLQGAEIGLRMQGVESLGGGSLKLGEIADIPDGGNDPEPDDFFPTMDHGLSNVVFYLDGPDEDGLADTKIKINFDDDGDGIKAKDLDDTGAYDWLKENYLDDGYTLIAYTIHAGDGQKNGYLHNGEGPGVWLWDGDQVVDYSDPGYTNGQNAAPKLPAPDPDVLGQDVVDLLAGNYAYEHTMLI